MDSVNIRGVAVPRILYGTAWKEEATASLTETALRAGFRGIDTANQRRHYHEAAVGQAIAAAIASGTVARQDLFLQTKFTFRPGQDHRLPYDPAALIARQVQQSLQSSLQHLGVDRVDSYLLHGPVGSGTLTDDDWQAWRALEAIQQAGQARMIGVSNFTARQLQQLLADAQVPPAFVQNRCFAVRGWDRQVRAICQANDIVYQGFSLLTANGPVLAHPTLARIAEHHGRSLPQIVFRFSIDVGMIVLTGTTSEAHMQQDLDVFAFRLDPQEVQAIDTLLA